ncbi:tetratricopeptide repeat protein [bacterium]|nr:tetratricopeptide repeat protein [bacterium]
MKTAKLIGTSFLLFCITNLEASDFRNNLAIGFHMNAQKLIGDGGRGAFEYGWNPISFRYNFRWHAYLESDVGFSQLSIPVTGGGNLDTDLINLGVKLGYRFLSESKFNPIAYFGLGVFNFKTGNSSRYWDGYGAVGGGAELFLTNYLGLNLTGDLRYTTGDDFDDRRSSTPKDSFVNLSLGMNYYFGGRGKNIPEGPEFGNSVYGAEVEEIAASSWTVATNFEQPLTEEEPFDPVAELRNQLMESLAEKERTVGLLRAKVNAFEKRRAALEDQLRKHGQLEWTQPDLDPKTQQLQQRLQAGLAYFAEEKYEDAILSLKSILYEEPDGHLSPTCWYWLGECHFNRGEYHAAIESFEITALRAPVDSPKRETARIMLALCRWQLGEVEPAKSGLEEVLANISNSEFGPILHEYLIQLSAAEQVQSAN